MVYDLSVPHLRSRLKVQRCPKTVDSRSSCTRLKATVDLGDKQYLFRFDRKRVIGNRVEVLCRVTRNVRRSVLLPDDKGSRRRMIAISYERSFVVSFAQETQIVCRRDSTEATRTRASAAANSGERKLFPSSGENQGLSSLLVFP